MFIKICLWTYTMHGSVLKSCHSREGGKLSRAWEQSWQMLTQPQMINTIKHSKNYNIKYYGMKGISWLKALITYCSCPSQLFMAVRGILYGGKAKSRSASLGCSSSKMKGGKKIRGSRSRGTLASSHSFLIPYSHSPSHSTLIHAHIRKKIVMDTHLHWIIKIHNSNRRKTGLWTRVSLSVLSF